ncbi:FtsH protease activity modulator HflK [Mariniblastus fucicola]|uniref:Protein HflK n=1 Tax=Mariniblastus fucicola TaxID=980251 RepID=A0A5B9PD40_9BACT|nr:FtsH protease activity modulator HflK [Mariniblastus fucicola]QEG20961.1 Modulator of FtsH protease HflK [Mariniblastus fucicola]
MPDYFDDDDSDFNQRRPRRGDRSRRSHEDAIQGIKNGLQSGAFLFIFGLIALLVYTSFYRVDASAEGVVLRFGEKVRTVSPGLQMKMPWPIESVYTVPVMKIQSLEFGFQTISADRKTVYAKRNNELDDVADMLTGDLNLAHVEWIVQYQISDSAKSLFNVGGGDGGYYMQQLTKSGINPAIPDTIRDVSETVMRKLVGDRSVDAVLTMGREEIANEAKRSIQEMLDEYDIGVQIVTVKLQTTSPPESVKDAFQEVNRARQNKERVVNEAEGERNRQIPAARGRRDQMISEAEGYRELNVLETQGLISAFNAKLAEYEKAPEITKQRLYLEAMEEVLSSVGNKTIIDDSVNQMLPILNIGESTPGNPLRGNSK